MAVAFYLFLNRIVITYKLNMNYILLRSSPENGTELLGKINGEKKWIGYTGPAPELIVETDDSVELVIFETEADAKGEMEKGQYEFSLRKIDGCV